MRHCWTWSLALYVLGASTPASRAGDAEALATVERAIRAHGGADQLAKARILIRTGKGEIGNPAGAVPFTGEAIFELPERARWTFDMMAQGQKVRVQVGIDGQQGWRWSAGAAKDLGKEELQEFREEIHVTRLTTLLPLKADGVELTVLPAQAINDVPVAGVRVACKGHRDVKLWFDARDHYLLKAERRTRELGQDFTKEYFFAAVKEFEGVKLPTRIVEMIGDRKAAETQIAGYRFPGRVDDSVFGKP